MSRPVASKEVAAATLRELRAMLANTPDAAKIFYGEIDRRWLLIPLDKREWVCRVAGCEGVAGTPYTQIEKNDQVKIRAFLARLRKLLDLFGFALSQW